MMRRVVGALAVAFGLTLGAVAPAPVDAHGFATSPSALCAYIRPYIGLDNLYRAGPDDWTILRASRGIHYGTAHVYQCEYDLWTQPTQPYRYITACLQYVDGASHADLYPPPGPGRCW